MQSFNISHDLSFQYIILLGFRWRKFCFNGLTRSGAGSYILQSSKINGKVRTLSTFRVIREPRSTLAELVKTTMDIFYAAVSYKYSSKDSVKKIYFVLIDSTAHILVVVEKISKIYYEHWFYLSIDIISKLYLLSIYHWYFIAMFWNIFNDPRICWLFYDFIISLEAF